MNSGRILLRVTQLLLLVILLILFAFFGLGFLNTYHLPYNEEGRYFDESNSLVYHEQSVLVYGFLSFLLLLLVIGTVKWMLSTMKRTL